MTKTSVRLLETWRTRMFHQVTPPEDSSLLRPYFSRRTAASLVVRPVLDDVSGCWKPPRAAGGTHCTFVPSRLATCLEGTVWAQSGTSSTLWLIPAGKILPSCFCFVFWERAPTGSSSFKSTMLLPVEPAFGIGGLSVPPSSEAGCSPSCRV